jgi:hypothetical protein
MPGERKEPILARASLGLLLLNLFLWAGLRNLDILMLSLISSLVALLGAVAGYRAYRRIRKHGGRIPGEAMAMIGYWFNLILFILVGLLFCYSFAMAFLRGEIL